MSGAYQQLLMELLQTTRTLQLATVDHQGQPDASLVPYLYDQHTLWILVSTLSRHTLHLQQHPQVSVLIYNNEITAANPFAIPRLTLYCHAQQQPLSNYHALLDIMGEKLGNTVSVVRQLTDFCLFQLTPHSGRLVAGFGKAFNITADATSGQPMVAEVDNAS